jgi:dienelactone hydrolase
VRSLAITGPVWVRGFESASTQGVHHLGLLFREGSLPEVDHVPCDTLNDAFETADHLRGLPIVMADRIALMGFSTGGMTGLEAASASSARYSQGRDFAAIVSFYPYCDVAQTKRRFLPALLAAPLLVLMGDLDTEMPPDTCRAPLNALKAAGQPIDWELYAGATHCWDCVQYRASGLRKRDWKGDPIEYRYNVDVTLASQDRAFAFLAKYLER